MISCLVKKLENWDAEFRKQHNIVLDLIEDESESMEQEQSIYNKHDKKVTHLSLRLQEPALEDEEAYINACRWTISSFGKKTTLHWK